MVSISGGATQRIQLNIQSHPANLARVRRAVEALGSSCGFDETSRGEIGLCVNEALANIIRHAYDGCTDRPIAIIAEFAEERLRITIRDWGKGTDPSRLPPSERDLLQPGGLGLICLKKLMDEVVFTPQPDGMLLVMSRQRAGRQRQATRDVG